MYKCHLSVEDPLIRADDMLVTEEQVKILQGLCQEERLLHIILVFPNLAKGKIYKFAIHPAMLMRCS